MLDFFTRHNIKVDLSIFYRIHNADIFGGTGSEGYMYQKHEGVTAIEAEFIDSAIQSTASALGVKPSDIEVITEAEYTEATREDDYEEGVFEDEDY